MVWGTVSSLLMRKWSFVSFPEEEVGVGREGGGRCQWCRTRQLLLSLHRNKRPAALGLSIVLLIVLVSSCVWQLMLWFIYAAGTCPVHLVPSPPGLSWHQPKLNACINYFSCRKQPLSKTETDNESITCKAFLLETEHVSLNLIICYETKRWKWCCGDSTTLTQHL